MEKTIVSGVPKAVEEAMENLSNRMSSFMHQKDIIRNISPFRILGKEMKEMKDLADILLTTRILDHEAYGPKIQQNFQRVREATISFFVRTVMFI